MLDFYNRNTKPLLLNLTQVLTRFPQIGLHFLHGGKEFLKLYFNEDASIVEVNENKDNNCIHRSLKLNTLIKKN